MEIKTSLHAAEIEAIQILSGHLSNTDCEQKPQDIKYDLHGIAEQLYNLTLTTPMEAYYTVKYNNISSHRLDTFATLTAAVASAKALHCPDWPTGQGIRVKHTFDNITMFDSSTKTT